MRESIDWDRRDWAFTLGCLAAAFVVVLLLPQDALFSRGDTHYFTALEAAADAARQAGQFPLWNVYFSEPLLANPQSMLLYPPWLLFGLLPAPYFLHANVIVHLCFFAVSLYLLLRHLDLSRLASAAAAVAVAFAIPYMFRIVLGHHSTLPVFGWSVLTLLFFGRLLHHRRFLDFVLCLASSLMLFLAGHTQFSMTGFGLAGSYFLFYLIQTRDRRSMGTSLLYVGLLGVFSAGLLAALLLPVREYAPLTIRVNGFVYEQSMQAYALTPYTMWSVLVPFLTFEWARDILTEAETFYYSSMILPGLAWLALKQGRQEQRQLAIYTLILGAVAVLLALGSYGPFGRLIFAVAPFIRAPGRFLLLWILPAAILIGQGIDLLQRSEPITFDSIDALLRGLLLIPAAMFILWAGLTFRGYPPPIPTPIALGSAIGTFLAWAVALALWKTLPARRWLALFVALLLLDSVGHGAVSTLWPAHYYQSMRHETDLMACVTRSEAADPLTLRLRPDASIVGLEAYARAAASYGLPGAEFYSAMLYRVFDLLVVYPQGSRIYAANAIIPPARVQETDILLIENCQQPLYFDPLAAPRVGVVNQVIPVEDSDEASLEAVLDPAFDPFTQAVISVPEGAALPALDDSGEPFEATAEIAEFTPNQITIHVESSAPGLLVLAESDYPGWEASVNGDSAPVWRANHALRAVFVPAGASEVVMTYRSRPFEQGLWISGGSLIALFVLGLIWPRLRRRE